MVVFDLKQKEQLTNYMEDDKMAEELSKSKIEQINKMPIIGRAMIVRASPPPVNLISQNSTSKASIIQESASISIRNPAPEKIKNPAPDIKKDLKNPAPFQNQHA